MKTHEMSLRRFGGDPANLQRTQTKFSPHFYEATCTSRLNCDQKRTTRLWNKHNRVRCPYTNLASILAYPAPTNTSV